MQRKSDKSTILKVSNIHRQHKRYRTMTLTSHKEEREMTSNHFKSNTQTLRLGWEHINFDIDNGPRKHYTFLRNQQLVPWVYSNNCPILSGQIIFTCFWSISSTSLIVFGLKWLGFSVFGPTLIKVMFHCFWFDTSSKFSWFWCKVWKFSCLC